MTEKELTPAERDSAECPKCGEPMSCEMWRVDKDNDPYKMWCGNQSCKSVEYVPATIREE